jgi:hypothetical protein
MRFQQEPEIAVVPPPTDVEEMPRAPPVPVVHVAVPLDVGAGIDALAVGAATIGLGVKTGADGLIVGMTGGGLRPAPLSSVEPSGIPTAPPGVEPIALGDEADAAEFPAELLLVVQPLDIVGSVPPPSYTELEPDMPVVEPVLEPAVPQTLPSIGDTPDVVGLTPGDASSIAPRGMPVGATAEPGPMPSGEVMPSGDPPTCAMAELQLTIVTARVAHMRPIFMTRSLDRFSDAIRACGDTRSA